MEVGTSSSQVFTLDDLTRELHRVFEEDEVNVEEVHELMTAYKSNPAEWKKFAKFDRYKYTRNLIDAGNGKFNLMLVCWGPSHVSAIHDHADSHCFMKAMKGSLQEVRYEMPADNGDATEQENGMTEISRTELKPNGVYYINNSLGLHQVENTSHSDGAVSMHLYCPPFSECACFDLRTGRKMVCPVTFWSKFGKKLDSKNCRANCQ